MTDSIKLPPYPEGLCLREDIEDYAREAVRLNATAPDAREMFNAGWCAAARFCDREDVVYDGLVGPGGCPAFEEAYRAALSAAPAAPQPAQPLTDEKDALIRQALDALEDYAKQYPHMQKGYMLDAAEAIRNHLGVKND